MKVLLAEDSATSRHLLQKAVEGLGHECRVTSDGAEAWEALQEFDAEVVLSDWVMPRLDGEELCRLVRAAPERPYVYFVLVTSLENRSHVQRGIEAGADDYMIKPLDPDELRVRLNAASLVTTLRRRRQETEKER